VRRAGSVVWAAFFAVGAAHGAPDAGTGARVELFAYDAGAPLVAKDAVPQVLVRDVTFPGAPGGPEVRAYVVSPSGKGPFAGALWVHWLGEPVTTNRTQFLDEAVRLAGRGLVSVLVDGMWSEPKWFGKRTTATDFDASVRQVVELRRSMDFLLAQPGVEARRVAYVGHDFGAMYGALMGSVDQRARTYVLAAGTTTFHEWFLLGKPPANKPAYVEQLAALDLPKYLPLIKNASFLFQFAKTDRYVPKPKAEALVAAAQGQKQVKWYEGDHSLARPEVKQEREEWLVRELGLR
jgi:dienelactone hydrolase